MKFENFDEAGELVQQIKSLKNLLDSFDQPGIIVRVTLQSSGNIISIGAQADCEHDARMFAIEFVENLKRHYKTKVAILIGKLETL